MKNRARNCVSSLVLSAALLICMVPQTASAQEGAAPEVSTAQKEVFSEMAVPFEGSQDISEESTGLEAELSETSPATDVENSQANTDGSIEAATASNTIILDPDFVGDYFPCNTKVKIPFALRSYGSTNEKYYVGIYNASEKLIAETSGSFPNESGVATLTVTWDTTGLPEDTYYVRFYATYAGEWDNYIFPFHLTNNNGKSYGGNTFKIDSDQVLRCYDKSGNAIVNNFLFDGDYTYYLQSDGTPMTDKLTYHPDGAHLIYFDSKGHEVFNQFQYCEEVDYVCYFDSSGYMYKDQITYMNNHAYYIDGDGRTQQSGWFRFANGRDYGYANGDGTLNTNGFGYDPWGRIVFYHWNGMVARGLITDGLWYYNMDETDGHYLGSFM